MSKEHEYKMLSGLDLVMAEFPEDGFCIQDIIPKGLVIFTTDAMEPAQKLAMDLCLRVVKGERMWKMDSRQGSVLYMIHQHSLASARNLILDMTPRVPDDLYVGVMTEDDLDLALTGIRSFADGYHNPTMVVIEMSDLVVQYENAVYVPQEMLPQFAALKGYALSKGIAVVVLMHANSCPAARGKKIHGDQVCVTDHADGHIDMCIVDHADRRAILRVDNPIRGTRLWDIWFSPKHSRWMEATEE